MTAPLALLIEDEPDIAVVFTYALQTAGYAVQHLDDGRAAQDWLNVNTPALVVLDLNLPHVAGETLLKHIRSQERLAQTRLIVATAKVLAAEGLHTEADVVLVKPISVSQLTELAARLKPSD